MADKKLEYKEIPKALRYVVKTLWRISPGYVIGTFALNLKNRLLPFVTLFIAAAITTQLPLLITGHDSLPTILGLLFLELAIHLADQFIEVLMHNKQQKAEAMVAIELREQFYNAYARLPYRLYESKEVIDAFQYADDFIHRFSRFGLQQIARVVGSVIEIIASVIALTAVAWYVPLIFVVFLPFLARSVLRLNREQARVFFENRSAQRRVWALEAMFYPRKIKETRLYGVVAYLLGERRKFSEQTNRRELANDYRRNRSIFWQDLQMQGVSFVTSAIAVWRVAYQGAPLGVFVLAQQLSSRASSAVTALFSELSAFDQDLYGFAEYRYITETLQPKGDQLPLAPEQASIDLESIYFTYPKSAKPVLRNVSLSIPFGSALAVVGENGAGKTTLTRILLGLYAPEKGSVLVGGLPLGSLDESSWLRRIGVLLQDFGMNEDITIREAIWLGDITKPKDDASLMAVLKRVELDAVVAELPHGLDTNLGKWVDEDNGTELSGGQLQRLAIARALFREPDILILDEPTSAIDANAEERILRHLMSSRKGKTTIFISHRFSTVRRAQQIVCMDKGKIIEVGTHDELMAVQGKYAQMFATQAEGYS